MCAELPHQKIRVILADDHPMLRAGFIASLEDYDDIDVVGETGNIEEVPALFKRLKPDVAVLDIMFDGKTTGLGAVKTLVNFNPQAKVITLSQFDQDTLVREAYRFGAMAFLTKDVDVEQLVKAIRKAHRGERYYLPTIAERLAEMVTRPSSSPFDQLSQREVDVLVLLSQGKATHDIAAKLAISPRTVADTIAHLKGKFQVRHRRDLIPLGHRYYTRSSSS